MTITIITALNHWDYRAVFIHKPRGRDASIAFLGKDDTIWSLQVASDQRGKGIGQKLIQSCVQYAQLCTNAKKVRAYIHPTNSASKHAFQKCGFTCNGKVKRPIVGCNEPEEWVKSL